MNGDQLSASELDNGFVPRPRGTATTIELEGEGVVYDDFLSAWHHLNPTALVIWQLCDGSGSVHDLARDLSDVFDEDESVLEETVLEVVREFGRQGLLDGVLSSLEEARSRGSTAGPSKPGQTSEIDRS